MTKASEKESEQKNDNNNKNTPFAVSLRSLCVRLFAPISSNCASEDMTK